LILGQLILGATMRHQHAGLAIPDFPAAYGKLWPDTDAAAIARYNENRQEVFAYQPITAAQVELQMVHRILAVLIFMAVAVCAWRTRRILGAKHWLSRFSQVWLGLVFVQILLGASTIWTGKSADVATMHVACGALCLVTGGLASVLCFRWFAPSTTQIDRATKNEVTSFLASSSMTAKAE
jgi:heme a synthase